MRLPQQLEQIRDKLDKLLSDESLTPKEFSQAYQIKMVIDDQIKQTEMQGQGQGVDQSGMLTQLMQGQGQPQQMAMPQQGPAPSIVPLGQYGAPIPQQQQGFSGVPSSGLLRGMM